MATFRPFAYNPGPEITGTSNVGTLAIGATTGVEYFGNYGGVKWFAGPDEDLGYVIAATATNMSTPDGLNAGTVQFWRSKGKSDSLFLNVANYVSGKYGGPSFADVPTAKTWLLTNNLWDSYLSVADGLLVYLDASNPYSYTSPSSTWVDMTTNLNDATLFGSPTYANNLYLYFDADLPYATIPEIGDLNTWTVECWFNLKSSLNTKISSIVCNQYDLSTELNFSIGTNSAPLNYRLNVGFFDGAWRTTTGFTPSINTWYQVVGTYDGSTIKQYVNGSDIGGSLAYSGTPKSGGEIRLMRRWDSPLVTGNLIDGWLSIVRIYSKPLSDDEVLQNFESDRSKFGI